MFMVCCNDMQKAINTATIFAGSLLWNNQENKVFNIGIKYCPFCGKKK